MKVTLKLLAALAIVVLSFSFQVLLADEGQVVVQAQYASSPDEPGASIITQGIEKRHDLAKDGQIQNGPRLRQLEKNFTEHLAEQSQEELQVLRTQVSEFEKFKSDLIGTITTTLWAMLGLAFALVFVNWWTGSKKVELEVKQLTAGFEGRFQRQLAGAQAEYMRLLDEKIQTFDSRFETRLGSHAEKLEKAEKYFSELDEILGQRIDVVTDRLHLVQLDLRDLEIDTWIAREQLGNALLAGTQMLAAATSLEEQVFEDHALGRIIKVLEAIRDTEHSVQRFVVNRTREAIEESKFIDVELQTTAIELLDRVTITSDDQ